MEEKKDYFENTEEQMVENITPEENDQKQSCADSYQDDPGIPKELPAREEETIRKEDTSYSYGERKADGTGYQPQSDPYEGQWDTTPLTMGDWLLTLLAAFIPCCGGIILYCYWAFSRRGNLHRRNFCRAALIVEAVLIALLIVFLILIVIIGSVSYTSSNPMSGSYYYGY